MALIGRPNVGKSTLLNRLLGRKLSIVSRKPQTTRWRLAGIKTDRQHQAIFIDTPGFQIAPRLALNRYMNREVINSIRHVDVVLLIVEALNWTRMDGKVMEFLLKNNKSPILIANKIDKAGRKRALLPFIEDMVQRYSFVEIIPISASRGKGVERVEACIPGYLPVAEPIYSKDRITDRSERFFASEFIREKLTKRLGQELPYKLSVTIEDFKCTEKIIHVNAVIWVETMGQKAIVIGRGGKLLKQVGQEARKDLQDMLHAQVNLNTWVRIRKKWADSEFALRQFGYIN